MLPSAAIARVLADDTALPRPLPVNKLLSDRQGAAESEPQTAPQEIPVEEDGPFQIVYPTDRPEWVRRADETPRVQSGEVVEVTVSSGPHVSWGEAHKALEEAIDEAAAAYVNDYLGVADAASHLKFEPRRINTFEEEPLYSIGRMKQSHALLAFDKEFNRQIEQKWLDHVAATRLTHTGLAAALVLGALSVVYGYFTADTSTRGAHRRRLQWGAGAAMATLAALAVFLFRWIL
jgi:hypothetical protein